LSRHPERVGIQVEKEVIPAIKLMQKGRTPIQKRKNSKSKKCMEKTRKRGIEKQDGNTD
jgi:hypothetical protein